MTKMGACVSTGQPEGQTIPARFPKPASSSTAPVQLTAYQQKAIATLKNIGSKSGPPLNDWKLPVSDDPNVELLVFPLLEFEGYHGGGKGLGAEVAGKPDANVKAVKEQTKAAAHKQESRAKAKRDKSGRVTSFRPLGPDEIVEAQKLPFWPDACDLARLEGEGEGGEDENVLQRLARERKLCLKRLIEKRIDSTPWPPTWDDIEAEVRLIEIKYFLEELDVIKQQSKEKNMSLIQCFPEEDWGLKTFVMLDSSMKTYEGTPSSSSCPHFKAWLMARQAAKVFNDEILPELEKESQVRPEAGGGGKQAKSKGKKGRKGSKKGKKK